jgi:DNA-binding protein YbaB
MHFTIGNKLIEVIMEGNNTVKGKELITKETKEKKNKKKYGEDIIKIVHQLSTQMQKINILHELKINHGITMSKDILTKILKNEY